MLGLQGNTTELELLFACARWPQREADRELIRQICGRGPDWSSFIQLVRHHRIVPLVAHNLHRAVPDQLMAGRNAVDELRNGAAASAMLSLRLLGELKRVTQALAAAGVRARVLKGFPLAQMVFGNVSLRSPGDLDLLIDARDLVKADRVITELGYSGLFDPARFSPKQLAFYRAHWKDVTYTSRTGGNELDLHWRCFRNPYMPGNSLCASGTGETVRFGGLRVETLPRREGLLYQCVHGALDRWVYLKPLVDVAAQVRGMSEHDLDGLAELAVGHGVLPELSATLLLVRRWLSMDHWSGTLLSEQDRTVRHILTHVEQTLGARGFRASRDEVPIGLTLRYEWGLRRRWPYRREVVRRVFYRARMWETIRLPDWLFWAYPLLSPVEWVLFRVRQRRSRAANV